MQAEKVKAAQAVSPFLFSDKSIVQRWFSCRYLSLPRQSPRDRNESRVRHHAVLRAHAHLFDVPVAEEGLERLDRGEAAVRAERIDERLHLDHRRQVAE